MCELCDWYDVSDDTYSRRYWFDSGKWGYWSHSLWMFWLWVYDYLIKQRIWIVNDRKICLKSWAPLSSWTSFLQTLPFRPSVILLRPTEVSSTKRRRKTGPKKVEGKEEAKNGPKAGKNGAKRGIEHKTTGYRTGTKRVCVCEAQNSNPIHK